MRRTLVLAVAAIFCYFQAFVPAHAQDAKLMSLLDSKTRQINQAFLKGDVTPILELFSPAVMITTPDGGFAGREAIVNTIRSGALKYTSVEVKEEKLAQFGDVAVFTHLSVEVGTTMQGSDISGKYRYTAVWARQAGEWKLVAVQITPVLSPPQ